MFLFRFFRSSLGLKIIMAVTGVLLFAFVIAHMLGNLQIFLGRNAINSYAHFLQSTTELLWAERIGLLLIVALHIYSSIVLTIRNRAARPIGYVEQKTVAASLASRTMMVSGLIVLGFIIFHILHFTVGWIEPQFYALQEGSRHDVYGMMVRSFEVPWISIVYFVGVGFLSFHLSHGLASMFRTLGFSNAAYRRPQEIFAMVFAALIFVGMSIVPASILILHPNASLEKTETETP